MRVERFDSVEEYASICMDVYNGKSERYRTRYGKHNDNWVDGFDDYDFRGRSHANSWDNGVDFHKAVRLSQEGDPTLVKQASSMVDKLVTDFTLRQEDRPRYVRSFAGSRVCVPEYLAGSPMHMRSKRRTQVENRGVSIYVSTTCAAVIPAQSMLKRGSTILALLEFLQLQQIAVDLFLLAETHGRTDGDLIQVIKVQSNPLDLSTAGFAIAHPAFARRLTYGLAAEIDDFNGQWGYSHSKFNYPELLAKTLGMKAGDIYIPPPRYDHDEIFDKPMDWLDKRLETFQGDPESNQ